MKCRFSTNRSYFNRFLREINPGVNFITKTKCITSTMPPCISMVMWILYRSSQLIVLRIRLVSYLWTVIWIRIELYLPTGADAITFRPPVCHWIILLFNIPFYITISTYLIRFCDFASKKIHLAINSLTNALPVADNFTLPFRAYNRHHIALDYFRMNNGSDIQYSP